jgi:hypothetical protein
VDILKKLVMGLLVIAMFSVMLAPSVGANGIYVYVNLDQVQYEPGEQGTLSITIRNTSEEPLEIHNVTVDFTDWMLFTIDGWDELGNKTIVYDTPIQIPSKTGKVALDDNGEPIRFTVPTDGRAVSTYIDIRIYTNKPGYLTPPQPMPRVYVISPQEQDILRAMDNIVLLLSVGAILAIISAIIIAAAVFLSGRRPGVTWQKEE